MITSLHNHCWVQWWKKLKIGQHLPKLWAIKLGSFFMKHGVDCGWASEQQLDCCVFTLAYLKMTADCCCWSDNWLRRTCRFCGAQSDITAAYSPSDLTATSWWPRPIAACSNWMRLAPGVGVQTAYAVAIVSPKLNTCNLSIHNLHPSWAITSSHPPIACSEPRTHTFNTIRRHRRADYKSLSRETVHQSSPRSLSRGQTDIISLRCHIDGLQHHHSSS